MSNAHIVLGEGRLVQDVFEELLVPLRPEGVTEATDRVHCVSRTHFNHMIFGDTLLLIIVRRANGTGELRVAFKVEVFWAVDSL